MNYTLSFFFALCFCTSGAFGQNTTIVFNTKPNTTIGIAKEIDNTYARTLTDQINIDATGNCTYSWDVNNFQFVNCSFYDGRGVFFPIMQGSHLTITYKGDGEVEFAGTDKAAIEYYNSRKEFNRSFMNSSFSFPAESGYEDYSLLIEKHHSILSHGLDSLAAVNAISPKFSGILKNDFNMLTIMIVIGAYRTRYLENAETKVSGQDSIKVEKKISEILDKISPIINSGEIFKYTLGKSVLAVYYNNKYRHLDEKDKEELLSKNAWANYLDPNRIGYMLVPKDIQYKLLSIELLDNYENAVTKGNPELFDYISKIRPHNAFLPYLKEKQGKLLASINADHSGIKYIENTINTLEDLSKVPDFDQKILYIDIWATWCGPCIAQFKHKEKLHEVLSSYKNIIPVYISIDKDADDMHWKEKTKGFNLNGYHLRANEQLVTDINEQLFDGTGIGIPRYILMDGDGNILNDKISGPINIDKLKQELDKHFD